MKKVAILTLVLASMLPATAALAQQKMDDMKGMDMGKKPTANVQTTHVAKATVKKTDKKAGTVTLAHEPVASLNWPAMTMSFKVKDKMLLNKLRDGKRVYVEFVQEGEDFVVTSVK